MGTSVNQRSPNTGGWRSVSACYTNETTSTDRTALEIWRAAVTQDDSIHDQLGSELVTKCAEAAAKNLGEQQTVAEVERLSSAADNHLVGEFAKRALLVKATGGYPDESFSTVLFRQITDYLVSRDISGHVGSQYRCKTVEDLRVFKANIADVVAAKVQAIERSQQLTSRDWKQTYPVLLQQLRTA
jgi:hypothetical protein